jgi:hypothetical protein
VTTVSRRAAYEAGTIVAQHPLLALPVARIRGQGVVLDPGTDVVIEGYPRSGNSFAVAAFQHAQPRSIRVAHHTHTPAQIIVAAKERIPALVLIRDPVEACLEFAMGKSFPTIGQALRAYVRFYRPLLPRRQSFVVGTYPEVRTDFGAVMERVNARFGTSFVPFEHTEGNVRACLERADRYWRTRAGPGLPLVGRVATAEGGSGDAPNGANDGLRLRYRDAALAGVRARAESLYRKLAGDAASR